MDRRRNSRVSARLPVRIWGVDAHDLPFMQLASVKNLLSASGPPTFEQRHITLSLGEGERIVSTRALPPDAPAGSIPARAIVYVIRLADGRTLLVEASGPEAAQGFDPMIDAAVMTLAPP